MAVSKTLYVRLAANVAGFSAGMGAAASAVEGFDRRVTGATTRASNSIGTLAQKARLGLGIAVAVGFAAAVKATAEFEKNMRNVNSISNLSERHLAKLSQQVIDLSKNLPTSAADLSSGLYDIASSGFQGAQGLTVLKASATAASAGLSTTAVAAKAIAGVLNAYGKSAGDAADVSDTLFQAVNVGVISFDELASNIGDFVGTAAAAKVPIDDAAAALAAITLSGISGAEASTALNQTMTQLLKPSKQLQKALGDLGYESGAQALQVDGLQGVMAKLRDYTGGASDRVIALFRNVRASKGALALMANDGRNFARSMHAVADESVRAGSTQRVLAEQAKSLSFQWDIFRNKVMALAIEGGKHVTPVLAKMLSTIVTGATDAGPALAMLLPVLGDIGHIVENLIGIADDLWDVFGPGVIVVAGAAWYSIIGTLRALGATLSAVTGFLSDHKAVLIAVAAIMMARYAKSIVFIVNLYRTLIGMRVAAAFAAIGESVTAAGGAAQVARGAFLGLATAEAAATLGITALLATIGYVVTGLMHASEKGKELSSTFRDKLKVKPNDVKGLRDAADAMDHFSEKMTAAAKHESSFFNWKGSTIKAHEFGAAADDAATRAEALRAKADAVDTNMRFLSTSTGLTTKTIRELATAAGVDLSGNLTEVGTKLVDYYNTNVATTPATQQLTSAIQTLGDDAASAADKVKALKSALDALIGVNLSAEEAASNYQAAIDAVTKSVKDNGTTLDITTGKGRANREAMRGVASSITDVLTAHADLGASPDKLAGQFDKMVGQFRAVMSAAGLTDGQIDALLKKYGLVPKLVDTIIKQSGGADVQAVLDDINKKKDKAKDPLHIAIFTQGAQQARNVFDLLLADITRVNKTPAYVHVVTRGEGLPGLLNVPTRASGGYIAGPGGPTDDRVPALLSNGEYVLRSSAVRAVGVGVLDRVNRFAAGGHVGADPSRLDRRVGAVVAHIGPHSSSQDIDRAISKVQTLLDHWNLAVQRLQDAAQRADLVKSLHDAERAYTKTKNDPKAKRSELRDAAQAVADARKQLRDFDADSARSAAQRRAEAKQRRLEARQTLATNREQWRFEHMTSEEQVAYLTKRMKDERRFSDEWMQDAEARRQAEQQVRDVEKQIRDVERQITANRKQWRYDHESAAQQLRDTLKQLAAVRRYSDEWVTLAQQAEALRDDAIAAQNDAFGTLNDLLDRADAIHQEQASAAADYARAQASAWADYTSSVSSAIDEATAKIRDYMALTERLTTDSAFEVTSTDQAGAERMLRSLGLLTDAMRAYDDAARAAPDAADLARNARAQTEQITEWAAKLDELRHRGLSQAVISALGLDESPAALGQVRALSAATQSEIDDLNAAVEEKNNAAQRAAATEAANSMSTLGRQIVGFRATLDNALASANSNFATQMADYQSQLLALGSDTGRTFAEAIAEGLRSGLPGVVEAANALVAAMAAAAAAIAGVTGATPHTPTAVRTGSWWGALRPWYATGGAVHGPGTGTSDSVPILASNGEYVLSARTVRTIGIPALDRMNRYADGGAVSAVPVRAQRAVMAPGGTVVVEQHNDFRFDIDARGATNGVGDEIEAALRSWTGDVVQALESGAGTR